MAGGPGGRTVGSMTTSPEAFQISLEAAELYESRFVPALFAEWVPHLLDLVDVGAGQQVLDVACGTGTVARGAAARVGPEGRVVGLDRNEAMLAVAGRVVPGLEWRLGDAARLPFPDASFDVVVCQMALMFFPDRKAAVAEMGRVAGPLGTVGLLVPSRLEAQPAYGPLVDVVAGVAGPEAVSLMNTYWACGDLDELRALVGAAGLEVAATRTRMGTARFDSVDALVTTEVESTPLAERIDQDTYRAIREGARRVLAPYVTAAGGVEAPIECHLVAATARRR